MTIAANERAERPPTKDVLREAPFSLRAADDSEADDGLTLDGYGAVFESLTVIDSYEGRFKEKIASGSMRRSFREAPPKVQFDHGRHPMIGSIPCAALRSISEDVDPELAPKGGAHVVARVFDNWMMQPIRDAIAEKAIDGMSFRFEVVRESWATADGRVIRDEQELRDLLRQTWYEDVPDDELLVRTLKELKVPEIGPVVWPAYRDTSVSVRSQVIDLGRLHEPEQRKLLAQAVFLADTAEQEDAQRDADPESAVEHPSSITTDEPEQQDSPTDAQRSTSSPEPVGEHPSTPRRISDMRLRLMNQRDRLLTLRDIGERPS
ncbi:HK97 family phage prohead protease [Mycobacterium adipatum]|uniref:HK97 family phage prohead protease n=1 Tax=Mycobacterium adipatum TaxID=1682113 RepID=UPI0034E0A69C